MPASCAALRSTARKRSDQLPDVPTLTELGYGDAKVASWFGVAAPAGTPPAIVDKLHEAFIKASRDPELIKRLGDNGTPIETTTPAQMAKLMAEESERTGGLVRELGLKQQ